MHRLRVTRTDVALSVLCGIAEVTGLAYYVHRKGWFRA